MRIVVSLGGNALLRRGEPADEDHQLAHVEVACDHLAPLAARHELVVSHGNGPQIGRLAVEEADGAGPPGFPLDVLGAETQGMVGYLIERELRNRLPADRPVATVLTMVEVDPADPAFRAPSKPIGPWYPADEAVRLAAELGWEFRADGGQYRRVVASPAPLHIVEQGQILHLVESGCVVVCAGGGGIPVSRADDGRLTGVEAVIDKDHAGALLARVLEADVFVMATDAAAACLGFGTDEERVITSAHPDALLPGLAAEFAAGSMLPKVTAACDFARTTGRPATIGALPDIEALVAGTAGTVISTATDGVRTDPVGERLSRAEPSRRDPPPDGEHRPHE